MRKLLSIRGLIAPAIAVAAIAGAAFVTNPVQATHEPANKVSASGSTVEVFGVEGEHLLLSETVKTSKPTDLILGVTAECALTTEITTVGDDTADATGSVQIWVEIDGNPVAVAQEDDGKVVFCNRTYGRETSMFDDDDATIKSFIRTRSANGFNWMALDVGSGVHTIEVFAQIVQEANGGKGDATAMAGVGRRTLIVEPTKAANDEAVTQLG